MTISKKRLTKAHAALSEFSLWFEYGMKPSIHNVLELKKANPVGLQNPILQFVVPRAMSYVVERFVLEVVQAWELLNIELKRQGHRTLGVSYKEFRHLKKIRNKLVAHKIENSLKSLRYENWYKRTYGDFENVLSLVSHVAERIHVRIQKLELSGMLPPQTVSTISIQRFEAKEVDKLLSLLKENDMY